MAMWHMMALQLAYHSEQVFILYNEGHFPPLIFLDDPKVTKRHYFFSGQELKIPRKSESVAQFRGRRNTRNLKWKKYMYPPTVIIQCKLDP